MIRAEAEVKRQRTQIEEKNRLFDQISRILKPRLNHMDRMLASGQNQDLRLVCILGAFIKRRSNLALICEENALLSVEELAYCIRESLIYLNAYGVVCAFHQEGKGKTSGTRLQAAYDFFEDCVEAALPTLSAMMVRVECGKVFSIRLMMEDARRLPDLEKHAEAGQLTEERTDDGWCLTLAFAQGGERP